VTSTILLGITSSSLANSIFKLDDCLHVATLFVCQDRSAGTSHTAQSVKLSAFFDCGQIDDELMSAAGAYSLDQVSNLGPRFSEVADLGV
jgi:hypothetical protein